MRPRLAAPIVKALIVQQVTIQVGCPETAFRRIVTLQCNLPVGSLKPRRVWLMITCKAARYLKQPAGTNAEVDRVPDNSSRIDPQDTILLLVDLQAGIVELSRTVSLDRLKKGVLGLSKLARIFSMPSIISGVSGQDGAAPNIIPQIAEGLGEFPVYRRATADSFRNAEIVAAVRASGRKTLLIADVSSEVGVQLPAVAESRLSGEQISAEIQNALYRLEIRHL